MKMKKFFTSLSCLVILVSLMGVSPANAAPLPPPVISMTLKVEGNVPQLGRCGRVADHAHGGALVWDDP